MKSTQISITLSVAALVLALVSVFMQVGRDTRDAGANVSVATEKAEAKSSDSQAPTPSINAAVSVSDELASKLKATTAELEAKVARLERDLNGLNRLVRASGLDVAVPMWGTGPGDQGPLFEQLGKEAASRARFEARREELTRQASEIQSNDYSRYGAERYRELEELFAAARPGRGSLTEEDRTSQAHALDKMLEEYPDAYATSLAVAEQALSDALNGDAGQVEAYLQTLRESSKYANIVTDQGVEAVPNIQTFLARQYIEQNRIDEAVALLDELSETYPNSLIMEPNTGGPPTPPRTAREVADELRQRLTTR